jgi:hypothetical protein
MSKIGVVRLFCDPAYQLLIRYRKMPVLLLMMYWLLNPAQVLGMLEAK